MNVLPRPKIAFAEEASAELALRYRYADGIEYPEVIRTFTDYADRVFGVVFTRGEGGIVITTDGSLADGGYTFSFNGGEAAIAVIYSGDAQYAIEKNDKLKYVIPEEGGNIWTDSMCVPKSSPHVAEAQQFIDFMCRPDVAKMNFEYIYYCSPIQAVVDGLSEEDAASATINPSDEVIARCEYFNDVADCMELYENVWMEVRLAR